MFFCVFVKISEAGMKKGSVLIRTEPFSYCLIVAYTLISTSTPLGSSSFIRASTVLAVVL